MRLPCRDACRTLLAIVCVAVVAVLMATFGVAGAESAKPRTAPRRGVADSTPATPKRLHILFLGDNGHHRPADRFRQLAPVLAKRGIDLTYTDKVSDLNADTLAKYDGLAIYANTERISPAQEKALLDYVASGKGLIPLHCASYCFLNSPQYIALVGAQFRSHGTGVFRTTLAEPNHPIMKGFSGFSSWDETYLHHKHNPKDRVVLEYRVDGAVKEPWTWVRTHGNGRVFYTAWGHDGRTWGHPGFQNLVERGIRWATHGDLSVVSPYGDQPMMTTVPKDAPTFRYVEAKVPYYPAGERWGTMGKPITKMQLPLSPPDSIRHIVHPDEFELRLFADEKQLGGKPICMNWDERGRLWVAITVDYPNERKSAGKGRDRILVLEDTKGTGRADKVTVFAEQLSIPTSLTFHKGGVVVHQAPETLYLKDTDGDGKADVRKVLFTGWHTNDTHAGPSNLRCGLDNWLYGIVGYAGFDGEVGGERHSFRQGFYRFKPDGSKMEFLRNTSNNSWGVGFSEEGLLFGSTANGCPSVYLPIPNRYYESVRGWSPTVLQSIADSNRFYPITDKVRQVDYHGGFTAAAGHALYTARTYPPAYWNRTAFVAEPTGHLVATFTMQKDGSNFHSHNAWNLLASDDEWCAPIMSEVGPDGNMWVIDWYNYIVQHNPTPAGYRTGRGAAYETDLRDKKHGRIYRLVYKKAPPSKPLSLADASPSDLVAALKNDNMFWRLHAQRLLVERGKLDVVPDLIKLIEDAGVDAIGLNPGAIHALWTLHGLGAMTDETVVAAATGSLKHRSAGVRRNALGVLPRKADGVGAILDGGLLNDEDAQVRLAAFLALAEMPANSRAGAAIASRLSNADDMTDRWIPHAMASAAAAHALPFLEAVAAGKAPLSTRARTLVEIVASHYAQAAPADSIGRLLLAISKAPTVTNSEVILAGLAQGWPSGKKATLPQDADRAMPSLLPKLSSAGKASLLRLTAALGSKGIERHAAEVITTLLATLTDSKAETANRIAAARQVVELRPTDDATLAQLLNTITPRTPPALTAGLLDAVSASKAPGLGAALLERMDSWTPAARTAAIRILLLRPDATRSLLNAMEKGGVRLADLALDQKQALAAHPDSAIAARAKKLLARGGDLPDPDRQKVVEKLTPLAKKTGDPLKGKAVFKAQCAKCHTHAGEGTNIGPDLTGMAAHPKEELIIHIFDPSRSVEGNFRVYSVTTLDGKLFTGMLASETRTTLEIVDSEAKRYTIQRSNVETLTGSNKSLMPEGFEKQLKEPEIVDLLEFLTRPGRYLPLPLDKVATAVSTRGMFYSHDAAAERLIFPDWKPKTFKDVPFHLVDPRDGKVPNVVLLRSPNGAVARSMPRSVSLPCNISAKAIHFLSGVSGWGYPYAEKGSVSMIVRLHYKDGKTEDHELKNGEHFADYIRRVDVPGSTFAFALRGQQIRYLSITPKRAEPLTRIDLVKGPDRTAPVVMAVTVETR
jgi:putative membrane-bound dehydrogenase-like protein